MKEFRRLKDGGMWHWVPTCLEWPTGDKDSYEKQKESPKKGKPCPDCRRMWEGGQKVQKKVARFLFTAIAVSFIGFYSLITYNKELPETAIRLKIGVVLIAVSIVLGIVSFFASRVKAPDEAG